MRLKAAKLIFTILIFTGISHAQIPNASRNSITDTSAIRPYLIAIVAADADKSAEWYEENLGFKITRKMDFPEYDSLKIIIMRSGASELELIQKKSGFSIKKYVPDYDGFDKAPLIGFAKIAFQVSDAAALADKLKEKKVKFLVDLYEDKDMGLRSFIIEDLDGNVLQFNQLYYVH